VPSGLGQMRSLVTDGGGDVGRADYVAAAATASGDLLVAYVPPAHSGSITIDLAALSGSARARWFNPTTGEYVAIATLKNEGTREFVPPGDNGSGQHDWVLVLDRP